MELAKIEVSRAVARKVHCDTLTAGMKGAEVSFSFDASWAGLKRIATFKAGSTSRDVLLTEDRCEIPHEVLERPVHLVVGVYGTTADGYVVIPTVWAELGRVEQGAKPSGDSSTKPTPEVWAQILGMIGDLKKLNTEDKSSLVAAINEVLLKGADPEEVERIVSEYLAENGIGGDYELPAATADTLGGIKAEPATDGDTQPVRIGEDGMLYTAPGGGGGEVWETIIDYTVPEDCSQVFLTTDINGNPFSLKKAVAYFVIHPIADPSAVTALRYTFDSSVGGTVYGAQHFWSAAEAPKNAGKATACRFDLQKTNEGVIATSMRDSGGELDAASKDIQLKRYVGYERIDSDPLTPVAGGINAVGVGSYKTAVGAGTRIKLLGVRE